jgi:hypothetical protein
VVVWVVVWYFKDQTYWWKTEASLLYKLYKEMWYIQPQKWTYLLPSKSNIIRIEWWHLFLIPNIISISCPLLTLVLSFLISKANLQWIRLFFPWKSLQRLSSRKLDVLTVKQEMLWSDHADFIEIDLKSLHFSQEFKAIYTILSLDTSTRRNKEKKVNILVFQQKNWRLT